MTIEPFCHLHVHTQFSPLDGVASPLDLMKECKARDWPAIAFTDHGNMATVPDAYFASQETGVKYIAGCELYFNDLHPFWVQYQKDGNTIADLKRGSDEDVVKAENIRKNRHITVLCKNMVGYRNLLQLMQVGWSEGFYYKPRIWMDVLDKYKEGLIVLTGCLNGPISWEIRNQNKDGIVKNVCRMMEMMGDDLYLEFQMPGKDIENSLEVFNVLAAIRRKFKLNGVITNDVHYITKKDFHLQKVLMAIDQNKNLGDPEFWCIDSDYLYLKTREELRETFHEDGFGVNMKIEEFEELCDNTLVVAEKCDTFKPDLSPKLPSIPGADEKLIIAVQKALKEKGLDGDKEYFMDGRAVTHKKQAWVELDRIIEKGFSSYFLIMSDIITHATKELKAQIGPARGCFTPDQVVITPTGEARISDIVAGDCVLDAAGDPRIVKNTHSYDIDEDIAAIELDDGQIIKSTLDHKFLVIRKGCLVWIPANGLRENDDVVHLLGIHKDDLQSKIRKMIGGHDDQAYDSTDGQ